MQRDDMKAMVVAVAAVLATTGGACGGAVAQSPRPVRADGSKACQASGGPQALPPPSPGRPASGPVARAPASATAPHGEAEGEWNWVQTQFPDAAKYHLAARPPVPLQELLSWARPNGTTTVYDRACRPIRVERGEDALHGPVNQETKVEGRRKTVHTDEVALGGHLVVTCGADRYYRRGKDGRWIGDGESFTACASPVGPLLSKVTQDAAWYNHEVVRLSITCAEELREEALCTGGGSRTCTRCRKWSIHARNVGVGKLAITAKVTTPADCRAPCAGSGLSESARRAAEFLEGREFLADGPKEHPDLFRSRAACVRYRAKHPIPADQLKTW